MKKLLYLFLVLLFAQCIATKQTRFLGATENSQIKIPVVVKKLNILNRTRPEKRNIVDVITDGVQLSYVDRPGVDEVLISFKNEAKKRQFFDVSPMVNKTGKANQSNNFPLALSFDEIFSFYPGDFLLASLEVFQVVEQDQFFNEQKIQLDTNGREYYINITRAIKTLSSKSGWRLYNSKNGNIVDEFILEHKHTFEVEGVNRQNAISKIEARIPQAYKDLGSILGFMYAERISPISIFVNRNYYAKSKSCPELKEAISFTKLDDWETAKNIWQDGIRMSSKPSDIAKLHYNLGVYYERADDVDNAIAQLELSTQNDSKIGRRYLDILITIKRIGYTPNL
jgi:tetratricopeptide (TPR) repeat protein